MSQMSQDNAGLGERLAEVGEKAASLADDATRKAGNAAASLASEAGVLAGAARDKAGDLEALVAAEIKAHPLRTLAFAAAAGAVLGFFAGR